MGQYLDHRMACLKLAPQLAQEWPSFWLNHQRHQPSQYEDAAEMQRTYAISYGTHKDSEATKLRGHQREQRVMLQAMVGVK